VGVTPYRIESARLVLRCYDPEDTPLLKDAVDRSLEHLRPWMDWTPDAPESLDDVYERLRRFRAEYDRDENWIMGAFSADESCIVGGTGLHPRGGDDSREIGYWIAADAVRQGYATELTAVLTRVGFEKLGLERVDLQIVPKNLPSQGVARKLGFVHEATLRRRLPPRANEPERLDAMVFTLLREEYEQAPWRDAYPYEAYDALGRPV